MLAEWLEKEANATMVKTAAQQFEDELSVLDAPSIAKIWRQTKQAENYVTPQANLNPGVAARQGAIGGAIGGGLTGAYGGGVLGGAAGGPPGALVGAGLGGAAGVGLGGAAGYGLGALQGKFDEETFKANLLAQQRMKEQMSAEQGSKKEKKSSVDILRLALRKHAERENKPNNNRRLALAAGGLAGAAGGGLYAAKTIKGRESKRIDAARRAALAANKPRMSAKGKAGVGAAVTAGLSAAALGARKLLRDRAARRGAAEQFAGGPSPRVRRVEYVKKGPRKYSQPQPSASERRGRSAQAASAGQSRR